jgi:hypothetical protein
LIGLAIFLAEARQNRTEVGRVELRGRVDLAGQEASAKRTERNEADAELFERGQYRLLRYPSRRNQPAALAALIGTLRLSP